MRVGCLYAPVKEKEEQRRLTHRVRKGIGITERSSYAWYPIMKPLGWHGSPWWSNSQPYFPGQFIFLWNFITFRSPPVLFQSFQNENTVFKMGALGWNFQCENPSSINCYLNVIYRLSLIIATSERVDEVSIR